MKAASHPRFAAKRATFGLAHKGLRPQLVAEIEDSALLETFGSTDLGVFPAALVAEKELLKRSQVRLIGACEGVQEHYYAISTERKVMHPLVQQILKPARR